MFRRRWLVFVVALAAVLWACLGDVFTRRVRAARLLARLASAHGTETEKVTLVQAALIEREVSVPSRAGPIRARLYQNVEGAPRPGLVLIHGVHHRGIDERRLVPFARALAESGRAVLTPELRDLTQYRISPEGVDVIAASAAWLSRQPTLVSSPRVGLMGFSFAGGLALVAAQRAELRNRIAFVSSVGGHHDLARVLRFFVSNRIPTPHGVRDTEAHEYGLVVLVHQHLDRFVEAEDRAALGSSFTHWLREDRPRARATASLRTTASGERLFALLESGRLRDLGPDLERAIAEHAPELAGLSPRGRLKGLGVPVYLLHGTGDSVIPASETDWAALELGEAPHRALVSPLLEHVEVSHGARLIDELALVDFMAQML